MINLVTLLVAGGVITALLLIPVLLIAGESPILGSWWVGGGGGGRRGCRPLDADAAGQSSLAAARWRCWRSCIGVIDAALGARYRLPVRPGGRRAAGGGGGRAWATLALVLLVHDWVRIGVILAALFFAGFAVFSIAGALWAWSSWKSPDDRPDLAVRPEPRRSERRSSQCYGADGRGCGVVHAIVFSLLFFFIVLTGFAYTTLLERKFIAWFQQRSGPNRVGPFGLLQPLADGIKLIFKEDIHSERRGSPGLPGRADPEDRADADRAGGRSASVGNLLIPWFDGFWYNVPLGPADPNVGVLWLLAITSIGTYGVVLAGWASNNKYAMIGGLRATAQMLSYELSLGLTMAVPILIVGSMSLGDIIRSQTYIYQWFIFQNPLAAAILFIALLAEVNRSPFDLPEAEQELTQGYMTEYSGMKFALFMMAEYLGMIAISVIVVSLYLGGYNDGFGLVQHVPFLGPVVLIGKVVLFLIFMIWIRATLPRIRYDRLMQFGWKIMLPLALVAVMWSAVAVMVGDAFDSPIGYAIAAGVFFVVVVAGGLYAASAQRRAGRAEKKTCRTIRSSRASSKGVGYYVLAGGRRAAGGAVPALGFHAEGAG